jgi:hypothetical protein
MLTGLSVGHGAYSLDAVDSFLIEPNADAFDKALHRHIADGEDRVVLDALAGLRATVADMRASDEDRYDVDLPVVNAAAVAAVALRRGKPGLFTAALDGLLGAYRLGNVDSDGADDADVSLYEAMAGGLWALGAVAVAEDAWDAVRDLAVRQPVEGGFYASWLRHAQVMSARRANHPDDDNILELGAARLRLHRSFGMSDATEEQRTRAVCAFDQVALIAVASLEPGGPGGRRVTDFYPSYAKHPAEWVEGAVLALRDTDGPARRAVFPHPDDQLQDVIRTANEMAIFQAAQFREHGRGWEYRGLVDVRTWFFMREGGIWEQWPLRNL